MNRRELMISSALGVVGAVTLHAEEKDAKVLIVVGPSNHPPGTHEVQASARLLQFCLQSVNLPTKVISSWPDKAIDAFAKITTVVFVGDLFPPEVMPKRDIIMADLQQMVQRGCGIVCLHYATGLEAKHVSATGEHPLLDWTGGYFATRCKHHQSIARVFKEATIVPAKESHPVLQGWSTFTVNDEPYLNNYFGTPEQSKRKIVLATAELPPEKPKTEVVAWAIERADTGRGAGIVMPHFYKNWAQIDLRTFILNTIAWTTKMEIPKTGLQVNLPDLGQFNPSAITPPVKKKN